MSMDTMFGEEKKAPPKALIAPEEVDKALAEITEEANPWVEKANALTIESDAHFQDGMALITNIKAVEKAATAKLAWALEPVKETEERTRSLFRPLLDTLKRVKPIIEAKLGGWEAIKRQEEAKRRDAEQKKLQQQMAAGKPLTAAVAKEPERPKAVETAHGAGSMTEVWYAEILNPEEVERIYCSPDQAKLDKMAKAMKDPKAAPKGVAFKFRYGTRVNNR